MEGVRGWVSGSLCARGHAGQGPGADWILLVPGTSQPAPGLGLGLGFWLPTAPPGGGSWNVSRAETNCPEGFWAHSWLEGTGLIYRSFYF